MYKLKTIIKNDIIDNMFLFWKGMDYIMEEELDIKELFIALWNKKIFIIIITFICMIFGFFKYNVFKEFNEKKILNAKEEYIAGTNFVVGEKNIDIPENYENITDLKLKEKVIIDDNLVATYEQLLKKRSNFEKLIEELNLDLEIEDLEKMVIFRRINNSEVLEIDVIYEDEEIAQKISISLAKILEQDLKEIYNISGITLLDTGKLINKDEFSTVKEADTSTQKSSSIKKTIIITAIGFCVACGIVIVLEIFDNTVKNENSLEKTSKLKTLAVIPNSVQDNKDKFRLLRVNINQCKTILITSPRRYEGKTYVAKNLAKAFNALGKNVLLIDLVNEKNNLVKKYNGKGLLTYLEENDKLIEKYINDSDIKNLSVLTLGKDNGNSTELLESLRMAEALALLEKIYDVIIIDGGSVLDDANTLAMSKIAKFSVLVINKRKTKMEDVIKAKNNIEDVGGNVLGNVFNKI